MIRSFRAPGKVVLLGEYAVLEGAPALVAAVDRGVTCTVRGSDRVRISTPGDDRFVRAALEQVEAPPAEYLFGAWNPVDSESKPGLGHSAAATVAAVLAGTALRGEALFPDQLQQVATDVHQAVQGSGSGIDVAASAHGGVIRFEAGRVTPARERRLAVVYSGESARTGPMVEAWRRWRDRDAFVTRSAELVDAFDDDPVGTFREARRLLERMGYQANLNYMTHALETLCDLAEMHGGGAKPSGAGGGDCAVALFPDDDRMLAWQRACAEKGFLVVKVRVAPGAHEELHR